MRRKTQDFDERRTTLMHYWLLLFAAIVLEVIGTTAMKLSAGLTRLVPSVLLFACYILAFVFLALALKRIEVSVAYAVWSGLGTALIAVIGVVFFNESVNVAKIVSLALIIVGVVGLNLGSNGH